MNPISPKTDPVHNLLGKASNPLDPIFSPRSVAVIGASDREGSVGFSLIKNLLQSDFRGKAYPVNPKHPELLGKKCFPDIQSVPKPVDLALIATPAETVPAIVKSCVEAGVSGAIVLSAGFREVGKAGADLEQRVLAEARRGGLRIVGPNCMGLMRPATGLNATFASRLALPGKVAFLSQSGALCSSILDWSLKERVGFSAFVSIGSMLDLGWGDFLDYLSMDPETQSILIYMESIGDAAAFLSAARETAIKKPIIVLKAGASTAAAHAAASHTGALTGSDEVLDAAFRRVGVLRVRRIAELFLMAEVLAKQPRPSGPNLAIVSNAGGPGVLATDALVAAGGNLAKLAPETMKKLDAVLPAHWSHGNPVDILGDAEPERYGKAAEIVLQDPGTDGLLVILTPQAMSDPTRSAECLKSTVARQGKPLIASWMGGADIAEGEDILNRNSIPTFPYPDTAAQVFQYMWQYSLNLKHLYETPLPSSGESMPPDREVAERLLSNARREGKTLLDEAGSKSLLAAYGIPTVPTHGARNEAEAEALAKQLGYPVVLKLRSDTITHKGEVGGVQLNLADADAVKQAYRKIESNVRKQKGEGHFQGVTVQPMVSKEGYELILGSSIDSQFGPVLLFGAGGELVEVFRDRTLALPPLTTKLAREMMQRTRIFRALLGIRGRLPIDLPALDALLVRFSQLVVEQPWIKEIDINPLLVSPSGFLALDARILLHDSSLQPGQLPRAAIRPYPLQYVSEWKTANGTPLTIRPIRPEDEPLMVAFHQGLSQESVYARYFTELPLTTRTRHDQLAQLCFVDYSRQMVLVAESRDASNQPQIVGIGNLVRLNGGGGSEFALLVADAFQRRGLGEQMLRRLIAVAHETGWDPVSAVILPDNHVMQKLSKKLGFSLHFSAKDGLIVAELQVK